MVRKANGDGSSDSKRLTVSLPRRLHDRLEREARENDASIAWVVRRAVASYLQENDGAHGSNARH